MFGPRHEFREQCLLDEAADWKPAEGPVLDAAAGLGTLTRKLARRGFRAVAVDRSLESLLHHRREASAIGLAAPAVLGDVTRLPFRTAAFSGLVTAETIEHIDDDSAAAREMARVVRPGGQLVVSTPADPGQWSDWDVWAEHRRRYRKAELERLFAEQGFECRRCRSFGFPLVRLYDALFLRRLIARRAGGSGPNRGSALVRFARRAGRSRWAIRGVFSLFQVDRLFEPFELGVGWTLAAKRKLG